MAQHYVVLSPLDSPLPYLWWACEWISSLTCIGVSIYFWRRGQGAWWLIVALAFLLPLISAVALPLKHGLPPLPYASDEEVQAGKVLVSEGMTSGATYVRHTYVHIPYIEPMLAIAFFWGYLNDRRRRFVSAQT